MLDKDGYWIGTGEESTKTGHEGVVLDEDGNFIGRVEDFLTDEELDALELAKVSEAK